MPAIFPGPFATFPPAAASVVSAFPLWAFWREQIKDGLNVVYGYTKYAFDTQHQQLTSLNLASSSVRPLKPRGLGIADTGVCYCEGGKRETLAAVGPILSEARAGKSMSGFANGDVRRLISVTDMLCTTFSRWLMLYSWWGCLPVLWVNDAYFVLSSHQRNQFCNVQMWVGGFYIQGAMLGLNGHSGGWYW